MYLQPYGDEQQLNLNWIINEIINLHKQLDPDYETPSFTQVYPYSNLNRLNLDWILSELKALKELAPEPMPELDIQAVAEALVALPFDSNTSYQIYDFISKDGEIWRATEAIAAGEVWDETKWFKTKIGTDLAVLERWINAINNSLTSLQNTVANLSSADISDDSNAGGTTVKASLNLLKGSLNTIPASRIRGKQIAIYGDSWTASYHGSLGADYISSYTGKTVHVGADPGGTLAHIYANVWDRYNADIYVIIGGLNDLGANTTLTAFQSTIYQFVNAIRAVNANAEIYFVTPPRMRTTTIHNYLYPLEAYRTVIFRRAADNQYNVINSLKWTDIAFESDKTHPVLADAPKIGKHIVDAIINFGDEETHLNDYSTVYDLLPNNVKLRCDNGALAFEFTALSVTLTSNLEYALVFPVANMGNDLLPFSFAVMAGDIEPIYVYHSGNANQIMVARKGAVAGDTLYVSGAVFPIGMRATIFE